jgi:diacylglycerol kinase (ATP)
MDGKAVKRAGLLVNPSAGKSSGKGVALAGMLAAAPNVLTRIVGKFEQLPEALSAFASEGVTDLFISSGDGTVQAVQTELAERRPFNVVPRLALLAHGTTNMTAADLGFRRGSLRDQAEFIKSVEPNDIRQRPTLRVVNPKDNKPRHGMFLGAGAAAEATLYCQKTLNARNIKGSLATFATLAAAVSRPMFTSPDPDDETRFDRPFPIAITSGGMQRCSGAQLLMLSTTLDKLILGARPFWHGKTAPIRTSVFPYPVPSIPRWLLPIMYGGENRKMPQGAVSFSSESLEISCPSDFVIDGEFFAARRDEPLKVETGHLFAYICG